MNVGANVRRNEMQEQIVQLKTELQHFLMSLDHRPIDDLPTSPTELKHIRGKINKYHRL